jgi:hypothetical protein
MSSIPRRRPRETAQEERTHETQNAHTHTHTHTRIQQAVLLSEGCNEDDDKNSEFGGVAPSLASSCASGTESRRKIMFRHVHAVAPLILGSEEYLLKKLHWRVQLFVFLLIAFGTAAFAFATYFIFNEVMHSCMCVYECLPMHPLVRSPTVGMRVFQRTVSNVGRVLECMRVCMQREGVRLRAVCILVQYTRAFDRLLLLGVLMPGRRLYVMHACADTGRKHTLDRRQKARIEWHAQHDTHKQNQANILA